MPSDQSVTASEQTSTYDHLWERTVVRSIEDAAVRDDPDGLPVDEAAEEPAAVAAAEMPSGAGNAAGRGTCSCISSCLRQPGAGTAQLRPAD